MRVRPLGIRLVPVTPTDIGYDTKHGRVLVPHVMEDTVDVYELKPES